MTGVGLKSQVGHGAGPRSSISATAGTGAGHATLQSTTRSVSREQQEAPRVFAQWENTNGNYGNLKTRHATTANKPTRHEEEEVKKKKKEARPPSNCIANGATERPRSLPAELKRFFWFQGGPRVLFGFGFFFFIPFWCAFRCSDARSSAQPRVPPRRRGMLCVALYRHAPEEGTVATRARENGEGGQEEFLVIRRGR